MIRKATTEDLAQIYSVYKANALDRDSINDLSYQVRIQRDGFLLGLDDKEDYEKLIDESHLFLIFEENGIVMGYIYTDHREKYYDDEYKTWFDLDAKTKYYNDSASMSLSGVAVHKDKAKKGVATQLLNRLESELKQQGFKYLYSIVTLAPVTNCASIVFHTKNKFRRIAMGKPRKLFNLDNYSGILLYKNLTG